MEEEVMFRERFEDAVLLAFKMEERIMSQGMQEASRSWKRQGYRFPSGADGRNVSLTRL